MKQAMIVLWSVITFWSCKKEGLEDPGKKNGDPAPVEESRLLVDKVYDYHNNLIAEYFYNDDNRLIQRRFTDPETGAHSDYDLQYENGKVSKISYRDYQFPAFNHDIVMIYNAAGQIIRDETYNGGSLLSAKNYSYYENGTIKGIADESNLEYCTVEYLNTNNAVKATWKIRNEEGEKDAVKMFTYDNHGKPDFGIGNVFQFDPLPKSNAASPFEKNISANNMTGASDDGTSWIYQYNAEGLPVTIETKWDGIDTETPMLIRIRYKAKK